jgi:hypothetical protein
LFARKESGDYGYPDDAELDARVDKIEQKEDK